MNPLATGWIDTVMVVLAAFLGAMAAWPRPVNRPAMARLSGPSAWGRWRARAEARAAQPPSRRSFRRSP